MYSSRPKILATIGDRHPSSENAFEYLKEQEQTLFKDRRHKNNAIDLQYIEQNFFLELFTMEFLKVENSRKR